MYKPFEFTHAAFDRRMDVIYNDLVSECGKYFLNYIHTITEVSLTQILCTHMHAVIKDALLLLISCTHAQTHTNSVANTQVYTINKHTHMRTNILFILMLLTFILCTQISTMQARTPRTIRARKSFIC